MHKAEVTDLLDSARYTGDTHAILANLAADMHSQSCANSNTMAPKKDTAARMSADYQWSQYQILSMATVLRSAVPAIRPGRPFQLRYTTARKDYITKNMSSIQSSRTNQHTLFHSVTCILLVQTIHCMIESTSSTFLLHPPTCKFPHTEEQG